MNLRIIRPVLATLLILLGGNYLTACGKSASPAAASPGATQLFPNINP